MVAPPPLDQPQRVRSCSTAVGARPRRLMHRLAEVRYIAVTHVFMCGGVAGMRHGSFSKHGEQHRRPSAVPNPPRHFRPLNPCSGSQHLLVQGPVKPTKCTQSPRPPPPPPPPEPGTGYEPRAQVPTRRHAFHRPAGRSDPPPVRKNDLSLELGLSKNVRLLRSKPVPLTYNIASQSRFRCGRICAQAPCKMMGRSAPTRGATSRSSCRAPSPPATPRCSPWAAATPERAQPGTDASFPSILASGPASVRTPAIAPFRRAWNVLCDSEYTHIVFRIGSARSDPYDARPTTRPFVSRSSAVRRPFSSHNSADLRARVFQKPARRTLSSPAERAYGYIHDFPKVTCWIALHSTPICRRRTRYCKLFMVAEAK
jgi:hypothetical protein